MDFSLLQLGILLGLGAAAPIGPVNVEIARRTLRGGFRPGFALGCGAVSVDVFFAVLSSQGFKRILDYRPLILVLGLAGIAILFYFAALCFVAARKSLAADPIAATEGTPSARASAGSAYVTGVLMTLLNPLTLAFWFVAVPGTLGPITEEPRRDLPMICAGVFVGTLGWVVLFAGLLAFAGRFRRPWWLAAADVAGGATLLGFALLALWRLGRAFL